MQGVINNEMSSRGLRYDQPDIRTLANAKLTRRMKEVLMGYMDDTLMTDEIREVWGPIWLEEQMYEDME